MHEYGIIRDLLSQVDEQVRGHQARRALRVVLAVDGGHVDTAFLKDAFDTFKGATTARDAELVVVQTPIEMWCSACGARSAVTQRDEACPHCGGPCVALSSTDEICLQSVEIEV